MKKILSLALFLCGFHMVHAQNIDRSKPPKPGPAPEISIKDPVIFKLKNGVTVLVVENHKLPKVSATLRIDRGPVYEGEKAGVLSIMGQMLNEGTKTMKKETFDKEIEIMGAEVALNESGGQVSALTRYFKPAFTLFADALQNPAFTKESFEKLKSQTLTGLKAQEKSAAAIASRMVDALNYGKNTAFGEFETEESIKGLTLEDVKKAYANYISPSRAYLVFSGDITTAEARKIATETLGNWNGKPLSLPKIPAVNNVAKTEINLIDVPTAVQAQLYVTNLIKNPMSNPDYFPLLLTNQILGGGMSGKLFANLREKHGFTYGSYSSIGDGRYQSLVSSSAQVRNEKADSAVAQMLLELKNMRTGDFTQADLDLAKAIFNGSFALNMEQPAIAAVYALNILLNDLPKDFYRTFLQKINAVTLQDIQRVSQKYISIDSARIIIVGNAEQIAPSLERLNYTIHYFDPYGNPVEKDTTTAKGDPNITSEKIIENYLKALGGKEKLQKVDSYKANISMDMMGQTLSGTLKKKAPYSMFMEITVNGMTAMKMVFDGEKGYNEQMGQKIEMTEEEITSHKGEKGIFPQLNYSEDAYKLAYEGIAKVNGEDAYKIKVTKPNGKTVTEFYGIESGYLLKEETTISAQGQEISQITVYSDYKEIEGIMTPTTITQFVGEQELPMKLSDIKYNAEVTAEDFK